MNDLLDDLKMAVMMDGNLCLRMSDPLDDRSMGGDHRDVLVGHHMNVMGDLNDLNLDVMMDGNLCLHMNVLDDRSLDGNLCHHMSDLLGDRSMGGDHRDVLVGHHMNVMGGLNDLNLDVMMDGNLCLHMNDLLDDRSLDGNLLIRSYAPHDLMMVLMKCHRVDLPIDPECYVMNHHVK
jgi:hypothetical protein